MEFLIKIAEWIISLVRQKNGVLEKELEAVADRYKQLHKDRAALEELYWKIDRSIIERQIATTDLRKKLERLNADYDEAVQSGLIELKFIEDAVKELSDAEAFRKLSEGGKDGVQ